MLILQTASVKRSECLRLHWAIAIPFNIGTPPIEGSGYPMGGGGGGFILEFPRG